MSKIESLMEERARIIKHINKLQEQKSNQRRAEKEINKELAKEFYGQNLYGLLEWMLRYVQRFDRGAEVTFPNTPEGNNDWCNYVSESNALQEYLDDYLSGRYVNIAIEGMKKKFQLTEKNENG